MVVRSIKGIIIHCTATRAEWWGEKRTSEKVAEIRRWHLDRGWRDIGYHFLIDRDGTIAKGRPLDQIGAHVAGHNTGTIGISLFGGHGSAETDQFAENFTPEQDKALRGLIADLRAAHGGLSISGHNEYAAKACPGFTVAEWWAQKPVTQAQPAFVDHTPEKPTQSPLAALFAAIAAFFGGKP